MGSSINLEDIGIKLSHSDAEFQRANVADLLSRHNIGFPGAQPVSFARQHLHELQQTDYFMCEKTDGVRLLLYLTHIDMAEEGMIEAQFLIDRKNDYYYIRRNELHLPRPEDFVSYHTGTLLDGELVQQKFKDGKERLAYLIFDCLAIDGENVMNRTFDKRLARIDMNIVKPLKAFARKYPEDVHAQPFQVEMKKMELPYGLEMMFRDIFPNLPHGNDGLIFTCTHTPYHPGTDQHILKWKPPHENTIDFRLLLGAFPMLQDDEGEYEDWDAKPEFELHVNHGGEYRLFSTLHVTATEWEAMKRMGQQLDGRVIECYYNEKQEWRPKIEKDGTPRFRDDKKDANHVSVVNKVMESISDAVTEQDLIGAARDIRDAFKKRQNAKKESVSVANEG